MVAPTILAHAIPEVRERYLRPLYRGDIVACQLFSEPVAGSDLAGIQTRAVRDGDEWLVIAAEGVDVGRAATATSARSSRAPSPTSPSTRASRCSLVDMKAPGVEVRPLRQMTGGASFNEVFFDEVRVPDSHRLGDVDEGWTVALTTLMNERAAIGGGSGGVRADEPHAVRGAGAPPRLRRRPARRASGSPTSYVQLTVARYTNLRAMAKIQAGQLPGPEMSIGKLAAHPEHASASPTCWARCSGRASSPTAASGAPTPGRSSSSACPAMRVAGGTDEIMRNIVGERVLGLPKEPRADR